MSMRDLIPWGRTRRRELWDPFEELRSMMEDPFGGSWPLSSGSTLLGGVAKWTPQVDIKEDEKHVLISASVPGVDKKDLHVDLQDNVLTIRGERKLDKEYEDKDR